MVNGTTWGVESAFLSCVKPGKKVILLRNVHQSPFSYKFIDFVWSYSYMDIFHLRFCKWY